MYLRTTSFFLTLLLACSSPPETMGEDTTGDTSTSTGEGTSTVIPDVGLPAAPFCGDSIINGEEECDSDSEQCWNCLQDRMIFVTRGWLEGDFGSIEVVDALCQAEADEAGRPGVYLGWVATSFLDDPRARFHQHQGRYITPGLPGHMDPLIVAFGWDDLTNGTLNNGIWKDLFGESYPSIAIPTGVSYIGGYDHSGTNCEGWTSKLVTKTTTHGMTHRTSFEWTDHPNTDKSYMTCAGGFHFYCFEQ